jgi:hypothetical protein
VADTNPCRLGNVRIGCAGWSVLKEYGDRFPEVRTHLARYAARFPAFDGDVAIEPRHPTWFDPAAERMVTQYRVARSLWLVAGSDRFGICFLQTEGELEFPEVPPGARFSGEEGGESGGEVGDALGPGEAEDRLMIPCKNLALGRAC